MLSHCISDQECQLMLLNLHTLYLTPKTKRRFFSLIDKKKQVMLLQTTEKKLSAFLQGQKAFCE